MRLSQGSRYKLYSNAHLLLSCNTSQFAIIFIPNRGIVQTTAALNKELRNEHSVLHSTANVSMQLVFSEE